MHRHLEPADPAARDGGSVARRQVRERDTEEVVDSRPDRSGIQPEELGRACVPVAQPEVTVEAEDGIGEARREVGEPVHPPLSGSDASAAASATTCPTTSAATPISSSTEPSRSASRPMAPAASSAALTDRRRWHRTDATAPSTAAATKQEGAIGDSSVAGREDRHQRGHTRPRP